MKRRLYALLAVLSLTLFMAVPAFALIESGEKYAFVGQDEVIDDDLFIAAEEVVIEGTINGDVFAAGMNIQVKGTINGDLYVAGAIVEVSGTVTQDILAAGDRVSLDAAQVGDSVIVAGSEVSLDQDSKIGGGLLYGASLMEMDAEVTRGMMGASAATTMNGQVGKNVLISTEEFTVQPDALIQGDLKFLAAEGTTVDDAVVVGSIEQMERATQGEVSQSELAIAQFTQALFSYLGAVVVGLILLALLPRYPKLVAEEVLEHPVASLLYGLIFVVAVPFVALLVMITIIGLPIALLALAKYFAMLYLGKIFVAAVLALALARWTRWDWLKKGNPYLVFILMLALFYVLKHLPFVGVAINILALLMAWGGMIVAGFAMLKQLNKTPKESKAPKA